MTGAHHEPRYIRFVNDVLLPHEAVERVRSEIVLETLKDTLEWPIA